MKSQIFVGVFAVLFIANSLFCHWIGTGTIAAQRDMRDAESRGEDPRTALERHPESGRRGGVLLVMNAPLLIGLGFIARSPDPGLGPLYWALLVIGSAYVPLIATLLGYMFLFPPKRFSQFPGVDIDDGSLAGEEKEEDDGDIPRHHPR